MPGITRRRMIGLTAAGIGVGLAGCNRPQEPVDFTTRIGWASPFAVDDPGQSIRYWKPNVLEKSEEQAQLDFERRISKFGFGPDEISWTIRNPFRGNGDEILVFSAEAGPQETRSTIKSAGFERSGRTAGAKMFQTEGSTGETAVAVTQENIVLCGPPDRLRSYLTARQDAEHRYTAVPGASKILDEFSDPTTIHVARADPTLHTISYGYRIEGENTICKHRSVYDENAEVPSVEVVREMSDVSKEGTVKVEDRTVVITEERQTAEVNPFDEPFGWH